MGAGAGVGASGIAPWPCWAHASTAPLTLPPPPGGAKHGTAPQHTGPAHIHTPPRSTQGLPSPPPRLAPLPRARGGPARRTLRQTPLRRMDSSTSLGTEVRGMLRLPSTDPDSWSKLRVGGCRGQGAAGAPAVGPGWRLCGRACVRADGCARGWVGWRREGKVVGRIRGGSAGALKQPGWMAWRCEQGVRLHDVCVA